MQADSVKLAWNETDGALEPLPLEDQRRFVARVFYTFSGAGALVRQEVLSGETQAPPARSLVVNGARAAGLPPSVPAENNGVEIRKLVFPAKDWLPPADPARNRR